MKKGLMIGTTVFALAFSTISSADIFLSTFSADSCENLAGKWQGTGKVTNWAIGECLYRGEGNVNHVDENGVFTLTLTVNKDSGSVLCPNHVTQVLPGMCRDGKISLKTDYGSLTGGISGNAGTAKGTISIATGISADVVVQLRKE